MQQIAVFGVYVSSTYGYFFTISWKFEFVDQVYHSVVFYQQIEIGGVFEGEHILLFCLEIQDGQERTLYGFGAVYVHSEISEKSICEYIGNGADNINSM